MYFFINYGLDFGRFSKILSDFQIRKFSIFAGKVSGDFKVLYSLLSNLNFGTF